MHPPVRPRALSIRWSLAATACMLLFVCAGASGKDRSEAAGPFVVLVKADAVRFTIRLHSDQKVADYQLYEMGEARRLLLEAAARNGKLSAAPRTPSVNFAEGSSFNISSGREYANTEATVDLFYPIAEGFNYLACAREVNALIKAIPLPKDARFDYTIEDMDLWVAEPEKTRPALLKLVADNVQAMSAALGGKVKFNITGLATPIHQRPRGDTQVELSLEPVISLEVF